MNAIPKMDEEVETLSTIEGIVPSLQKMPQVGCRFANRCPKAMPECKTITPQLAEKLKRVMRFPVCFMKQANQKRGQWFNEYDGKSIRGKKLKQKTEN